ncbi:hypothetical protein LIER_01300 [Lithospermum erythrorhizon]|uniref:LOB domain-containing protein n=1 Tax=Lithospermum erythrorhizon TaxID=34254 RepID=A0AAV3NKD4_LITER
MGNAAIREACAACKHQYRKCELEKCILRRFFPASETDTFLAVHEIFGVSIIRKTLQELHSFVKKDQVARAMKHEGILWRKDPVRGASGEISRLEQGNEMLKECLKALLENQRLKQENEFLKVSLENPRLKEENEFLKVQNEQLRNQLQGVPLPLHDHNTTPVEPHVLAPSAAEFENTQKGYAVDNESYIPVIENDGNLASIGQIGFGDDISQSQVMIENQEIACDGVEGYNGNNVNVGIGGYNADMSYRNVDNNVTGYDPLITPEMGAGKVGSWDMIEGHSSNDTINQSTSAIVGGVYDPSRVVGMEANGRIGGNVHTGWSSGSDPIHHGGYIGTNTTNDINTNERGGYDSGIMEAGRSGSNIVNGEVVSDDAQIDGNPWTYDFLDLWS